MIIMIIVNVLMLQPSNTVTVFIIFPFLYVNVPTFSLGPALMAMWSEALSLTANCLSSLSGSESHPGAFEKVASDLG